MFARLRLVTSSLARQYRERPAWFMVRALVLCLVVGLFVARRTFWTPDTLFLIMLVVFLLFGRARGFLIRFVPFVGLLLVYDSFRGIADDLNRSVHFTEMINFDRWLFHGILPTSWLQQYWWHGHVNWYDFFFYFFYTIHFIAPLVVALIIWWRRDRMYWPYMVGFVLLSFAGFLTYVLFPAAPPWMASDRGLIEPIHRISSDIWYAMGITDFSELYSKLSPNEVAAVPSLHAAYPTLLTLFVVHIFGRRRTWWLWAYPIVVCIGIVYLGEHYVFDALLGVVYAYIAYRAALLFVKKPAKSFWGFLAPWNK